jgi:hypothetical protein
MPNAPIRDGEPTKIDTDKDRHPDFVKAMRTILQGADLPDGPVERIEAFFHADGSCTYRVWEPRAENSEGGYISPDEIR